MKITFRLLAMLFLLTAICPKAAVTQGLDIVSPWKGPYGDLGRDLTWGVSGTNGMNNAFIINVPSPQQCACLFIRNKNVLAAHYFTLQAFVSADQRAIGYYTTPTLNVWTPVNVTPVSGIGWGINPPLLHFVPGAGGGGQIAVFSIAPSSGAKIAFVITGSTAAGGTDTADIFYTFGYPSPCSAYIPPDAQIFIDMVRSVVPAGVTHKWVGGEAGSIFPGAPQNWQSCSFYQHATLTGAAGTLNTYIQSYDSFTQTVDDRVSMVQYAASGRQAAQVFFEPNAVPHAQSVSALAAGSVQQGIMSDSMRIVYVAAGAGTIWDSDIIAICH